MTPWIRACAAGVVVFPCPDFLGLGVLMKDFYRDGLGELARKAPDGSMDVLWAAAVPVYVLLVAGIYWFVLPRAADGSLATAARWSALFGLVSYDLTNLATLRGYTRKLTLVDMAWGAVACATVAATMQLTLRAGR